MVNINAHVAADNPRECRDFIIGHRRVLEIFDIANITSAKVDWAFSKNTVILTIKSEGKLLGGARIQVADTELDLPIQDAVRDLDPSIDNYISNHSNNGGTGELCGLWNTRDAAKLGIGSIFLVRIGVAVSGFVGIESLFGLCAPSTVKVASKGGFKIEDNLGNNGTFYYPKLDLLATAMKIPDLETLNYADPKEKEIIFDLRKKPTQTKVEFSRMGNTNINYDLRTIK